MSCVIQTKKRKLVEVVTISARDSITSTTAMAKKQQQKLVTVPTKQLDQGST